MPEPFLRYLLEERVAQRGEANFLTFGEQRYSYRQLDENTNRVANLLLEIGLRPLDRLAVLLPNCPEFILVWFASIKLNITLVPINTHLKGEPLRYILQHSEPHALLTIGALWAEVAALGNALTSTCRCVLLDAAELPPVNYAFDYARMFAQAPATRPPDVPIDEEDAALIMYTSGTTGHSKGVLIGRRTQTNHPLYYHKELIQTAPDQTAYTYLPLFHVTSMGVTMGSFIGGAQLALDTEFNPFGFWERIRKHNATVFPYLGAVIGMLYARPARPDDAANPATHALGAAAPKEIWAAFEQRFGLRLLETYGQTEWKAIWTSHPPGEKRPGSAGKAPARAEIRIVDENDKSVRPGTSGQIIMHPAKPGLMMLGYYKQPELNARVFKNGWFYTGDVGEFDSEGWLYFKGRLKDYIRRRGENISAFEIENVVNTHPAILESAAVGVPAAISEEDVMLCVVLKPENSLSPPELYSWCRQQLPKFMLPRYIKILPELPRTPTQRVRKFLLAEAGPNSAWDRKSARNRLP